jgi:hypothetical protein
VTRTDPFNIAFRYFDDAISRRAFERVRRQLPASHTSVVRLWLEDEGWVVAVVADREDRRRALNCAWGSGEPVELSLAVRAKLIARRRRMAPQG